MSTRCTRRCKSDQLVGTFPFSNSLVIVATTDQLIEVSHGQKLHYYNRFFSEPNHNFLDRPATRKLKNARSQNARSQTAAILATIIYGSRKVQCKLRTERINTIYGTLKCACVPPNYPRVHRGYLRPWRQRTRRIFLRMSLQNQELMICHKKFTWESQKVRVTSRNLAKVGASNDSNMARYTE